MKWKAMLALVVVYVAVVLEWSWIWGVVFLMWTIPAFYSGRTHLVEEVDRDQNPILFWAIVGTWILLSGYLIVIDVMRLR